MEVTVRDSAVPPSDMVSSVARALRVLEVVGESPTGLSPKQIARRCDITIAAAYRMLRTLAHQGYVMRRADGAYTLGLAVADRFRELVSAMRGPAEVGTVLRRASAEIGYSHYLGSFVDGRIAITAVAEGFRSPHVEDLVPGFDEGAHATALGKNLLATLDQAQRERYLKEHGMRAFTQATLRSHTALDADIAAGMRRGMQVEIGQFRPGVACASVSVQTAGDLSQRFVVACALPAVDLVKQAPMIRERLHATARTLQSALNAPLTAAHGAAAA
ncbi:helix-turn-helix domain-containing protein [Catellatospora sp. NPDC049111]|uniref:IclR family transcriptional regulator n=1 Tax=Catellatospora sp. NPDC049111 TaxID=3155271 RepID=UPI0033CA3892